MRLLVHAVGRLKTGPERELGDRYFDRCRKSGAALGLDFAGVAEIPESRAQNATERRADEASRLRGSLETGAALVLLDETGRNLSSDGFATWLSAQRDEGRRAVVIAIGGADGHDAALKGEATLVLSFGALTWPHQLARIMLAEQLYRATTILSGHPYHRA